MTPGGKLAAWERQWILEHSEALGLAHGELVLFFERSNGLSVRQIAAKHGFSKERVRELLRKVDARMERRDRCDG